MHVKKKLDTCAYHEMPEPNSFGFFLDIPLFLTKKISLNKFIKIIFK
jgi:hypothetical protein